MLLTRDSSAWSCAVRPFFPCMHRVTKSVVKTAIIVSDYGTWHQIITQFIWRCNEMGVTTRAPKEWHIAQFPTALHAYANQPSKYSTTTAEVGTWKLFLGLPQNITIDESKIANSKFFLQWGMMPTTCCPTRDDNPTMQNPTNKQLPLPLNASKCKRYTQLSTVC